jgi:hypothetical protein
MLSSTAWIAQEIKVYTQPVVKLVSGHLGTSHKEAELVVISTLWTIAAMLVVSLVSKILFPSKPSRLECCMGKFMEDRKAVGGTGSSIQPNVSGGGSGVPDGFLRDIQHQLTVIQNEIQQIKQEREVVDQELIETSTQILQALGTSMMPIDGESENFDLIDESPPVIKPVPNRPLAEKPTLILTPNKPVTASEEDRYMPPTQPVLADQPARQPVVPQRAHPEPLAKAKVSMPVVVSGIEAKLAPAAPVVTAKPPSVASSSPASRVDPKQASVAAAAAPPSLPQTAAPPPSQPGPPKLSALAMARMKREQEQADTKSGQVPQLAPGTSYPFSKAKPGPFGTVPPVK